MIDYPTTADGRVMSIRAKDPGRIWMPRVGTPMIEPIGDVSEYINVTAFGDICGVTVQVPDDG